MDPNAIVIFLKGFYLPRQIRCIPEQQVIQIFSTNGSNQSFDEGMGHWYKGSSLDLLDARNSEYRQNKRYIHWDLNAPHSRSRQTFN